MCSINTFYTSPSRTDRSTDSTSVLIKELLHLLPKYIPHGISFLTASRFLHRTGLPSHRFAYRIMYSASPIGPNRSGPRLLQPIRPMLSLSLNTPPQAQLEALRDLPAHGSGSSWLHASLALLDLFDSARFDPSGRLVCSHGLSQLSCCCGVGASSAAFSSSWATVDSAYLNQTSEPTRLPPIGFRSRPSWLSPTRLRSSNPRWHHLPLPWLASALSFGCSLSVRIQTFPRVRPRLLQPI